MKKLQQKTINQTFSLPSASLEALHAYVKRGEMSCFVTEAIEDKLKAKKEELYQAYLMANEDADQLEATRDWEFTLADDSDE
jgi:hypothetical protein